MDDRVKLIAHALVDLIKATITIENGFHYDIGESVFNGKQNYDETELPFVSVLATGGEGKPSSMNKTVFGHKIDIFVEGYAKPQDIDNPADTGYDMRADIFNALKVAQDTKINGTVSSFTIDESSWGTLLPKFDNEAVIVQVMVIADFRDSLI